ncbi:probable G-protein coupled receptor 34 [Dunckerocampus dactyliophorus]|uniref:probable G-protein coupled receptor 34 n=1 Tax=Dunckerocampus dactyliophorus TaxID=161453 RepID=UPI002407720D|nr:probable G-protein coupled receptor 34 [Dunckerocampus dactyliophorus]XP_054633318.1 probable G-protein coupled receptor 34 [Dunckerocampus dactyliophorus]
MNGSSDSSLQSIVSLNTTPSHSSAFSLSATFPQTSAIPILSTIPPKPAACSFDDAALHLLLPIFYSMLFLLGLVGNLFALWVFLFIHNRRNSVRVFLINCAVADLVLLACLPFRIFYHMNGNRWLLGHVACKLVGNLFYMNMYISIILLGLISLDRYLRFQGKGRMRRGSRTRLTGYRWPWSWLACGALWVVSLVALVAMIATAEDKEDNDKCFQFKPRNLARGKAYFNIVLVALFWLVFLMLVASYAKIAHRLIKVSRDKPELPNAQRYERTAKKSFFVLFLFTLCFAPYHTFRPFYILSQLNTTMSCDKLQLVDSINEVMLLFSAFNSCLDPVMYFLLSGSVRKTALHTLKHQLGSRISYLNEATSNSSTTEFRRPSVPLTLPSVD